MDAVPCRMSPPDENAPPGWSAKSFTTSSGQADYYVVQTRSPGAKGPTPGGLHGAFSTGPKGNRVYFGYGTSGDGVSWLSRCERFRTP